MAYLEAQRLLPCFYPVLSTMLFHQISSNYACNGNLGPPALCECTKKTLANLLIYFSYDSSLKLLHNCSVDFSWNTPKTAD